jgi:hypothetical protein
MEDAWKKVKKYKICPDPLADRKSVGKKYLSKVIIKNKK